MGTFNGQDFKRHLEVRWVYYYKSNFSGSASGRLPVSWLDSVKTRIWGGKNHIPVCRPYVAFSLKMVHRIISRRSFSVGRWQDRCCVSTAHRQRHKHTHTHSKKFIPFLYHRVLLAFKSTLFNFRLHYNCDAYCPTLFSPGIFHHHCFIPLLSLLLICSPCSCTCSEVLAKIITLLHSEGSSNDKLRSCGTGFIL